MLCSYLFDLAGAFMSFYEACPVLKADDQATRTSRLLLCKLTARTIEAGLGLLGIVIFTLVYAKDGAYDSSVLSEVLGFSFGASSIDP